VFDTHAVNPSLIPNMSFDTKRDLVDIILIGKSAMVLATPAASEYKTFADVVAAAKAKKNVSYGSIGSGSLGHLAMALIGKSGGLDWQHIPYRGGGPLMADAVAGHVPLAIGSVFVTKPHIDSKKLRPLAVTTSKRSPDLPDVPTIAESGYAGFEAPAWWAVIAPSKTPADIVQRVNAEINKILKNADIAKRLDAQGIDIVGGSPAEARVFIERQMTIWDKVVKDNGIKAD
jgi:tripartite-type tricarboxylate transporter receptor subunit TctC